ncbi:hypothetical protein U91I_03202 [alpha proteobacterium U9-1i]|nr:hypothetical protein U91I_03202 [alpha proteobacterium U9-1i]
MDPKAAAIVMASTDAVARSAQKRAFADDFVINVSLVAL